LDPDYLERGRQYLRGAQGDATPDSHDLLYLEKRTDLPKWMTDHGWAVTAIETLNLMQRYDRPPENSIKDLAPRNLFIEGRLHSVRRYYCES
jgi:O-methyltransferase involved in polyketide biosynthesis